ncbi:hypothetical protein ACL02T_32945 [Pseudonocardia sp. RS010]|uniref:hypothetical protein n=1 Tax=Pseudonocardia sp. RS010 TaxID=3385979 RepID=UPI00399F710D
MSAFNTAARLRTLARKTTDQLPDDLADLILEEASQAVRDELGQQVDRVVDDVWISGPGRGRVLLLPQLPVTDVASVELDNDPLTAASYSWSMAGVLKRSGCDWPDEPGLVVVTYTHGYAPDQIPETIRSVTLQVAARFALNPDQVTQLSIGDYSRSWASSGEGRTGRAELTEWERRRLAPYRAR